MDDRIYTVYPYRSGKPPATTGKKRFLIICVIIVCYVILVGIVVLVVILAPKHAIIRDKQHGLHNKTEKLPFPFTTKPSFRPSPRDPVIYDIDPRSSAAGSGSQDRDRTKYHGKYESGWDQTGWVYPFRL